MKGLSILTGLFLMLRTMVCVSQTDPASGPVDEYTIRIETRERNGRPIPATLTITNENTRKVQRGTLQSGSYTVALAAGSVYRLDANHTGYRPAQKVLRLDRVFDPKQSQQTVLLEMDREVSSESPINVTVVDYDTKQRILQTLNVQVQEFNGKRVIMTGPPREGRFTFLAEFGQRIRFTVEVAGYQPYEYTVDVKEQHDITIRLQRARPVAAPELPRTESAPVPPASTAPATVAPPVTTSPAPATAPPVITETKPTTGPSTPPATTDLSTLTTGKTVTLDNVYFDQSSYLLRPESHPQLNQLVALLKNRPELKIEISGHTDNVGDPRLNLALSENRARVITSYLIGQGIAENRLRYKGYGQTKPITPNDTEENKRKNRRVEVRLLE